MDTKEVERLSKQVTKAYNNGESATGMLRLLGDLKAGVSPTEELLRSTRIGVAVNRVRSHPDARVARLASELVHKWKEEVKRRGSASKSAVAAASSSKTSKPASPASAMAAGGAAASPGTVPPSDRNHKTDNVKWQVTQDPMRDNCIKLMYDGLVHTTEEPSDKVLKIAAEIEKVAFETLPDVGGSYKPKLRSLFQNLKNKSNPGLRHRVLSGDIAPARFVVMTHDELKSDERRAEDARLEKENMNEAMVAQVEKSVSDSLTCSKCKQKTVSYSQAQTRSADEPMTTFCECLTCSHRWKFS